MRDNEIDLASIPERALQVLTRPAAFFRDMSRAGGFLEPMVFVVVMGIVNGPRVAVRFPARIGGGTGLMIAVAGFVAVILGTVIGSCILAKALI